MTEKEAINELQGLKNNLFLMNYAPTAREIKEQAISIAISALKRQIPKKCEEVSPCKSVTYYQCPCCDKVLYTNENFCGRCSQAIDWGNRRNE